MGLHGEGIESVRCARLSADSRAWTPLLYTVIVLGLVVVTLSVIYFLSDGDGDGNMSAHAKMLKTKHQDHVKKIINYLTSGPGEGRAYARVAALTDKFGPRMTGTENLEEAIEYVMEEMRKDGLENVHKEPAEGLPYWVRGVEKATLLASAEHKARELSILGLGSSIATPEDGITADAVVVRSFEELETLGEKGVKGKIVVFNQPWVDYPTSAVYRTAGASSASKFGAVAALIRSVASFSVYSPHTGQQYYQEGVKKIPVASITVEDALMLYRMQTRKEVLSIHMFMSSHPNGTVTSHNTVAEIVGTTYPNEIVLISGHLDSWDVGEGAMDDGGGVAICWQALATLRALNLRPKRTVRAVFWTAEEQGLLGSQYYYQQHSSKGNVSSDSTKNETFVFVYESDAGAFKPNGLNFCGNEEAKTIMKGVMNLLAPINASRLSEAMGMGDVDYWRRDGVPAASLVNEERLGHYFTYHHTRGDTMDTLTPDDMDYASVLTAVVAYVVADLEKPLPKDQKAKCGAPIYLNTTMDA